MGVWRLGVYELQRRLGEGGMAQVYLARDSRLGREVAVKVLDRKLAERPGFRERFMREARVAAGLDHPNIVPLYDFGEDEALYLVMPYISGGSLQDMLARAPLPVGEVVIYGSQIADALEYAHQRKVIHRDVKPANMLLHADGRLMLSDFGLAKIVQTTHTLSAPRNRPDAGTPEYMAPEQVVGSSDARSDIYGLGVVLYLLLTGRLPFTGASSQEVMQAHLYKEPPPLRYFNTTAPAAIEAVVMRAMAKQPAERFQRANELGAALLSALIANNGEATSFVISHPSRSGSRPNNSMPITPPQEQPADHTGAPPPWRQQVASRPAANAGHAGQTSVSGQDADAPTLPQTPAASGWDALQPQASVSASSSLSGILPNLNTPFTALESSQRTSSESRPLSGASHSGQPGASRSSAHSGFSGQSAANSLASSIGGGFGSFADSQTTGSAFGVPTARTMGRMPTVSSTQPSGYPPTYPPSQTTGVYPMFTPRQERAASLPLTHMTPVASASGERNALGAAPHTQQDDVRATLPGSRMTEPPSITQSGERRSLFWAVIAVLLIVLVIAVIVLMRWLEAGAAGATLLPLG